MASQLKRGSMLETSFFKNKQLDQPFGLDFDGNEFAVSLKLQGDAAVARGHNARWRRCAVISQGGRNL